MNEGLEPEQRVSERRGNTAYAGRTTTPNNGFAKTARAAHRVSSLETWDADTDQTTNMTCNAVRYRRRDASLVLERPSL